MIPKVAGWKPDRVDELKDIVGREGIVGVVDISGVPAKNMLDTVSYTHLTLPTKRIV